MSKIYSDGYCIGRNPSMVGGGYTIMGENIFHTEEIKKKGLTSNEAELKGVWYACILADKGDEIVTDSQNSLRWIAKGKCKARPDLSHYAEQAKKFIEEKNLNVYWRPREENEAGWYNEENFNA